MILIFMFCWWQLSPYYVYVYVYVYVHVYVYVYFYKIFRCDFKYHYVLIPTFCRTFGLSVVGINFLHLHCHDSYHDDSCCPQVHVISGATATHDLCNDVLVQNEPVSLLRISSPYSTQEV